MRSLGHVEVGGCRFEVVEMCLSGGEFRVDIELPRSTEEARGRIFLYGEDGDLVLIGKTVIIPPHKARLVFRYGVAITSVFTASEIQDLSMCRGWR